MSSCVEALNETHFSWAKSSRRLAHLTGYSCGTAPQDSTLAHTSVLFLDLSIGCGLYRFAMKSPGGQLTWHSVPVGRSLNVSTPLEVGVDREVGGGSLDQEVGVKHPALGQSKSSASKSSASKRGRSKAVETQALAGDCVAGELGEVASKDVGNNRDDVGEEELGEGEGEEKGRKSKRRKRERTTDKTHRGVKSSSMFEDLEVGQQLEVLTALRNRLSKLSGNVKSLTKYNSEKSQLLAATRSRLSQSLEAMRSGQSTYALMKMKMMRMLGTTSPFSRLPGQINHGDTPVGRQNSLLRAFVRTNMTPLFDDAEELPSISRTVDLPAPSATSRWTVSGATAPVLASSDAAVKLVNATVRVLDLFYSVVRNNPSSIIIFARVLNSDSRQPIFNVHLRVVSFNSVDMSVSTASGLVSVVGPSSEAWVSARVELPVHILAAQVASSSTARAYSVSVLWQSPGGSDAASCIDYWAVSPADKAATLQHPLREVDSKTALASILAACPHRASLEINSGFIPVRNHSSISGVLALPSLHRSSNQVDSATLLSQVRLRNSDIHVVLRPLSVGEAMDRHCQWATSSQARHSRTCHFQSFLPRLSVNLSTNNENDAGFLPSDVKGDLDNKIVSGELLAFSNPFTAELSFIGQEPHSSFSVVMYPDCNHCGDVFSPAHVTCVSSLKTNDQLTQSRYLLMPSFVTANLDLNVGLRISLLGLRRAVAWDADGSHLALRVSQEACMRRLRLLRLTCSVFLDEMRCLAVLWRECIKQRRGVSASSSAPLSGGVLLLLAADLETSLPLAKLLTRHQCKVDAAMACLLG